MRRFQLARDVDITGISGTGVVADGVCFPDGTCVIRWRGDRQSTVIWPGIEDVEAIHGHGGNTRIEWLDAWPSGMTVEEVARRNFDG